MTVSCLLSHTGKVPVQTISGEVFRLSWRAELWRDDWPELPPESRRWSFVNSPLDVASVVAPNGPLYLGVERGVAGLVAGGNGLASAHDQITGVVGDWWRRGVPYLHSPDWSVTVKDVLHAADEFIPLQLARVRPGDSPAPVDGVQVSVEAGEVDSSPVSQHAVRWPRLPVARYTDARRQLVMMRCVRTSFNAALSC